MDYTECWYKDNCPHLGTRICKNTCPRYLEMVLMLEQSGLPVRYWTKSDLYPSPQDRESFVLLAGIQKNITSFVKEGRSLFVGSTSRGNGKTTWAAKLLKQYFNTVWENNGGEPRGYFIHYPTFVQNLGQLSYKESAEEIKKCLDIDFLVLDDLGFVEFGKKGESTLQTITNSRYMNEKPVVLTGVPTETIQKSISYETQYVTFIGGKR